LVNIFVDNNVFFLSQASVSDSPLVNRGKSWLSRQLSRVESFRSTSSSSSFFGRNRSQSQVNGTLAANFPGNPQASSRRLSIYDRIMNRRSSKDKRLPSPLVQNHKQGNNNKDTTLMPQSRFINRYENVCVFKLILIFLIMQDPQILCA